MEGRLGEALMAESRLREKVGKLESNAADLEDQISRLNMDLDDKDAYIDRLRKEVKASKRNYEEAEDRIREMEDLCAQYRKKIKDFKHNAMKDMAKSGEVSEFRKSMQRSMHSNKSKQTTPRAASGTMPMSPKSANSSMDEEVEVDHI